MQKIVNFLVWFLAGCCLLFAGWLLMRILVCDQFVVPSDSMQPTLMTGDRILVNKLIAGPRIYKKFDFAKDIPLRSFRIPGMRPVRVNDVVVFNAPRGYDRDNIEFRINYVYAKRCVGTPGDSVAVRNGYFWNNRYSGPIGVPDMQRRLSQTPDSLLDPNTVRAFPFDDARLGWTIRNMGPLYVPRAGMRIGVDSLNSELYRQVIEYETGGRLTYRDGVPSLDGKAIGEYTFCKNYYFFCGDNVFNSKDCRYLGFVPEEFIIGVVKRITYSKDYFRGGNRPGRMWKRVE